MASSFRHYLGVITGRCRGSHGTLMPVYMASIRMHIWHCDSNGDGTPVRIVASDQISRGYHLGLVSVYYLGLSLGQWWVIPFAEMRGIYTRFLLTPTRFGRNPATFIQRRLCLLVEEEVGGSDAGL